MIFVIGDIHGELDKLISLIKIIKVNRINKIIFIGDYIDKGRYSKEVIEYLLNLKKQINCIFLRGNHEYMFLRGLSGDNKALEFLKNYGGKETIQSYIENRFSNNMDRDMTLLKSIIPKVHIDFLEKTLDFHEETDFYMVHAGVNPDKPDIYNWSEDLFFIRDKFIQSKEEILSKRIIFGHTAFKEPLFEPHKVGIDTGAVYNEYGRLTAYNINEGYCIDHTGEIHLDPYYLNLEK